MNFPSSPTNGQTYTDPTSGNVYQFASTPGVWRSLGQTPSVGPTGWTGPTGPGGGPTGPTGAAASNLIVLSADTTYYVRQDGSNSNSGLANNSGGAFQTLAYAMLYMYKINANNYAVQIKVADGHWTEKTVTQTYFSGVIAPPVRPINASKFEIVGNEATPDNCFLDATTAGADAGLTIAGNVIVDRFSGFKVSSGYAGIEMHLYASLNVIENINFIDCPIVLVADHYCYIEAFYNNIYVGGTISRFAWIDFYSTVWNFFPTALPGLVMTDKSLLLRFWSQTNFYLYSPENCTPDPASTKYTVQKFSWFNSYGQGGIGTNAGSADATCLIT